MVYNRLSSDALFKYKQAMKIAGISECGIEKNLRLNIKSSGSSPIVQKPFCDLKVVGF
jgi:hypothetical protein